MRPGDKRRIELSRRARASMEPGSLNLKVAELALNEWEGLMSGESLCEDEVITYTAARQILEYLRSLS